MGLECHKKHRTLLPRLVSVAHIAYKTPSKTLEILGCTGSGPVQIISLMRVSKQQESLSRRRWPPPRISSLDILESEKYDLPPPKKFLRVILRSIAVLCWSKAVLITAGLILYVIILVVRNVFVMVSRHYDIKFK